MLTGVAFLSAGCYDEKYLQVVSAAAPLQPAGADSSRLKRAASTAMTESVSCSVFMVISLLVKIVCE